MFLFQTSMGKKEEHKVTLIIIIFTSSNGSSAFEIEYFTDSISFYKLMYGQFCEYYCLNLILPSGNSSTNSLIYWGIS